MNFQRGRAHEELELNLIPMIDILLCILIFLFTVTTYSKSRHLELTLPQASAADETKEPSLINVEVDKGGQFAINNQPVAYTTADAFGNELKRAAGSNADPTILIHADAKAPHDAVMHVLEAASLAKYAKVTFAMESAN